MSTGVRKKVRPDVRPTQVRLTSFEFPSFPSSSPLTSSRVQAKLRGLAVARSLAPSRLVGGARAPSPVSVPFRRRAPEALPRLAVVWALGCPVPLSSRVSPMASRTPRLPLAGALEELASGASPQSPQPHTPMSCGSPVSPFAAGVTAVPSEGGTRPLTSALAPPSEEEMQGVGALLARRYRPGSDWLPDPLPYDPPTDTLVG